MRIRNKKELYKLFKEIIIYNIYIISVKFKMKVFFVNMIDEARRVGIEKGIKTQTMNVYITKFKRLVNEHLSKEKYESEDYRILLYPSLLEKEFLNNIDSDYEKISILNSLMKILEFNNINLGWTGEYQKMIKRYNDNKVLISANDNERKNYISYEDIEKKRDEYYDMLINEFTVNDIYYIILALYTYIPPLRSEDYCNTVLYFNYHEVPEDERKENYLCLTNNVLVIKNGKTSDVHGPRVLNVPKNLCYQLKLFKIKSNSKYVICNKSGDKLSSAYFTKLSNDAIGKKVSSSMMRKIYVSKKIIDENKNAKDRIEIAKQMGHTVNTQMNSYGKFSNDLHQDKNNDSDKVKSDISKIFNITSKLNMTYNLLCHVDEDEDITYKKSRLKEYYIDVYKTQLNELKLLMNTIQT